MSEGTIYTKFNTHKIEFFRKKYNEFRDFSGDSEVDLAFQGRGSG